MLLEKDQKVSQNSSRLSDSRSYASIRIQKDKNYKVFFFFLIMSPVLTVMKFNICTY